MKKILSLICVIMFFCVIGLFSQPSGPGGGPGGGDPPVGDPPVGVPIDGGALALLLAGAAYGVKKIKDKKKIV